MIERSSVDSLRKRLEEARAQHVDCTAILAEAVDGGVKFFLVRASDGSGGYVKASYVAAEEHSRAHRKRARAL